MVPVQFDTCASVMKCRCQRLSKVGLKRKYYCALLMKRC